MVVSGARVPGVVRFTGVAVMSKLDNYLMSCVTGSEVT